MNINLSQIIWTVICFVLFAVVLDRLLIRPVLDNMDKRRDRIDGARERKSELEQARLDAAEKAKAESEARRELMAKESEARLAEAAANAEKELESLAADLKAREDSALDEITADTAQTDAKLCAAMDGMIDAFTQKLMTGGDL